MPDDNTPDPKPEDAYPPPSSAYPPPNNPPNSPPPSSNPYGTPPANPYGASSPPPSNPYGTPSSPPNNPYNQQGQTPPPAGGYGTQPPQSNWQPPPPAGMGGYGAAPNPVNGQMILILGILGIIICGICAPIAWIMGNNALKTLDQYGDPMNQRGIVNGGRICGIIGTALMIVYVVVYIAMMALGVAGSMMHPSS